MKHLLARNDVSGVVVCVCVCFLFSLIENEYFSQ